MHLPEEFLFDTVFNLRRVLKPGGRLLVSPLGSYHFWRASLCCFLRQAGFLHPHANPGPIQD